ncbi:MAG: zinc ribbon domain-containing protein [Eggerthellaceae bacterium]|nr:zinc ribbon domain-containing protein [Eggerthellaceae bacterium]
MLQSFTRNYEDESSEAGFQFTFYCDNCRDGFKSKFTESATYNKGKGSRMIGQGIGTVGSLIGGRASNLGWAGERASGIFSERFEGRSPEWQREHQAAFEKAQNEVRRHFHRCPNDAQYVCDHCWNEDTGLCVSCSPRQEVYIARAHAEAMQRNIDEAGQNATVWQGKIESKTTICLTCGKPAGIGKFCNNCGASMALNVCPKCGAQNALAVRFCNNCGLNLAAPPAPSGKCASCGLENPPGTKFCGGCGTKLA